MDPWTGEIGVSQSNYACVPQLLKPMDREPVLPNKVAAVRPQTATGVALALLQLDKASTRQQRSNVTKVKNNKNKGRNEKEVNN